MTSSSTTSSGGSSTADSTPASYAPSGSSAGAASSSADRLLGLGLEEGHGFAEVVSRLLTSEAGTLEVLGRWAGGGRQRLVVLIRDGSFLVLVGHQHRVFGHDLLGDARGRRRETQVPLRLRGFAFIRKQHLVLG